MTIRMIINHKHSIIINIAWPSVTASTCSCATSSLTRASAAPLCTWLLLNLIFWFPPLCGQMHWLCPCCWHHCLHELLLSEFTSPAAHLHFCLGLLCLGTLGGGSVRLIDCCKQSSATGITELLHAAFSQIACLICWVDVVYKISIDEINCLCCIMTREKVFLKLTTGESFAIQMRHSLLTTGRMFDFEAHFWRLNKIVHSSSC